MSSILRFAIQFLSPVQLFATPWTVARQASLSFTISWSLLKPMSIESTLLIWWPTYWSFRFSISPSNEYSELIFFRIDWFDLLAVQGTLKSLLQYHSSKASFLQCSAFLDYCYIKWFALETIRDHCVVFKIVPVVLHFGLFC